MPRPLFSVRFPAALTEALDHCAEDRQWSRSDLVEKIITALTADDREEIVKTLVPGAATEKLNLRLSPEVRGRLTELAGGTYRPPNSCAAPWRTSLRTAWTMTITQASR
jgi:predicted transcriptional regulator